MVDMRTGNVERARETVAHTRQKSAEQSFLKYLLNR